MYRDDAERQVVSSCEKTLLFNNVHRSVGRCVVVAGVNVFYNEKKNRNRKTYKPHRLETEIDCDDNDQYE